jgi:hypothetical protein
VEHPDVQYAKSGDVHIAYQVTGEGPFDLVWVPGFLGGHLELDWIVRGFQGLLSSFRRSRA